MTEGPLLYVQAPPLIALFTRVTVSPATVRRLAGTAGAVPGAIETQLVERIERTLSGPPAGPAVQRLNVDGSMEALVGGGLEEVKPFAVGTLQPDPVAPCQVCIEALSSSG